MSRFKRLKQEKIKNTLKAISCVLALALLIGSVQDLGTYALFTDTEDIASNLAISTGDVDVRVSQGQTITSIGQEVVFSITNEGTLNQNISLMIEADPELSNVLGEIGIYFYSDTGIRDDIAGINNIKLNNYINLNDNDGKLFVLSPGQTIQGAIDLNITDDSFDGEYKLKLNVKARQINKSNQLENYGFYDRDIQENTVKIDNTSSIILEDHTSVLSYNSNSITIDFKKVFSRGLIQAIDDLNGEVNANDGKVADVKLSGVFSSGKYHIETNLFGQQVNLQLKSINTDSLQYSYIGKDYINIKFEYKNRDPEFYRLEFRKDRLLVFIPSIEAKLTKISEDKFMTVIPQTKIETLQEIEPEITEQTIEVVEPSTEEIEIPSEEVVEPSTEEIEVPSQEVVEPSTEEIEVPSEEVVQPSTEEIEVPSEEVVEPSTEENEAPSEEVVEPSTEENEAPSEEVVEPSTEEIEAPSEEEVETSTEAIEVPSEVVELTTEENEAPSEIEVVLPSKEETEIEE